MPGHGACLIREMRSDDLDRVVVLEKEIFSSPWSADMFLYELNRDGNAVFLVAEDSQKLCGYIGAQILDQEVHITNMAVETGVRRRGLGSALLIECIREGMKCGARWLTLEVRRDNDEARLFYKVFGFDELGVRYGYYEDTGQDAVIMGTGDIRSADFTELIAGIERRARIRGGDGAC
ncbi:MAG: ribosomal-protein-alanine N-acetyltransferase [Candidatus Anoxymicrobium japonicum]|uniref:Ribosomal-protein-alanine N-acetyltransferase n=1 Tax=Candidatus Anoxymicrobium japonicum TaxID=2013648 RepID=A0A2N3G483_9ACTN|nr:MAG: ribosomal-protein-alanine N-acetyltransferase [Candidatus Anoxymicrobium japonicum]